MDDREKLQMKFYEMYGKIKKKGLRAFLESICYDDNSIKSNLKDIITDETELIWYPGCGGDVSPCSVLERKKIEKENLIKTSNNRLYLFTDPDRYGMCEKAFGSNHEIYDRSVDDCSTQYHIEKSWEISIDVKRNEKLVTGKWLRLSLGDKKCTIVYLKMTMQDFLFLVVKIYELDIKWIFYIDMESKAGTLFDLFEKCRVDFPDWICANRVDKFNIRKYADLKPMIMSNGEPYYIEDISADIMFGPMKRLSFSKGSKDVSLIELLEDVNVLCRDNGNTWIKDESQRVNVIEDKLKDSIYMLEKGKLYLLYHKKDWSKYGEDTILISSHIDCKQPDGEDGITECFSSLISDEVLRGTYDNSITNASVLYLMIHNLLPENVIVAFTGDEEKDSQGAIKIMKFLKKHDIKFKCIVLDVTDASWDPDVEFTIENNFWDEKMGEKVIAAVKKFSAKWLFVPESLDNVPEYVNKDYVSDKESEQDESWDYDEEKIKCFSLCIPVYGEMHSDEGVYARVRSFENYTEVLKILASLKY